jgi:putative PIN family toxin of toxin-antitoxin system
MTIPQIVLDTNVLISGLRSRQGSSFKILSLVGTGKFDIHVSVPLVLEYREILNREIENLYITTEQIESIIALHCSIATQHEIFFLWRPCLRDPKDDMVLELAVKARCDSVVTHNIRDFSGIDRFGISVTTPANFLRNIGILS